MNIALMQYVMLPAVAMGVAALALALLHFLRMQPPRKTVATIQFWREAARDEHRNVLFEKFSRKRTFLFLLLIASLLAAALTGARWRSDDQSEPLAVVIDSGISMSAVDSQGKSRLSQAIELVNKDLQLTGNRPVIITSAGATPSVLVRGDQPAAIIPTALTAMQTSATPACSRDTLELASDLLPVSKGKILWYTDRSTVPESLPATTSSRVQIRQVGSSLDNAAIVNVIFEPSKTDLQFGVLRARVSSFSDQPATIGVSLSCTTQNLNQKLIINIPAGSTSDAVFENIRANGSDCSVTLAGGGAVAADDQVKVALPKRRPFQFKIADDVPVELQKALAAISSQSTGDNSLLINVSRLPIADGPAIVVSSNGSAITSAAAIDLGESPLCSNLNLEHAITGEGTGLTAGDSSLDTLLRSGTTPLAAISTNRLILSDCLFNKPSNFAARPAMFVLLSRAARHLAGWSDAPVTLSLQRVDDDPLWATQQTSLAHLPGDRLTSNLQILPTNTTFSPTSAGGSGIEPWQYLLAMAVGLFMVETWLLVRGRIV